MSVLKQLPRIREIRLQKGMPALRMSRMTGIHVNSIARYELGQQIPSVWAALKMCRALGITLDEGFGNIDQDIDTDTDHE